MGHFFKYYIEFDCLWRIKLLFPAFVVSYNSSSDSAIHLPPVTEDFSASFPQQGTHPPLACYLPSVWETTTSRTWTLDSH